jgi:hypothetical protein
MKKHLTQIQKIGLAVLLSLLTFGTAFAQAETAKIKDGTISSGASKAVNGAIFELESNNKGMLISRLSTAQRNAIPAANLSNGLLVYNTNTNCFDYWDALRLQWLSMCGTPPPAVFDISAVECAAITANGTYKQGVSLSGENTLTVPVTVTQPGTYTISATTANGYYFETSGSFPNASSYELTLRGTGRPNAGYPAGDAGDVVSLVLNGKVNTCTPHIYVEKASVDFSVNCASIVASGTYNIGLGLTTANKLTVSVNVTSPGFWNMSTNTVNGYSFSGQDTFTTTGLKTVELFATGTPIASGTDNFNLSSNANTPGGASCSGIPVTVAPVAYTMNCAGATQSGTYMQNVALNTASNTITLPVNVTATGSTTISTNTVNGVSFSSGPIVLTALGAQEVVLKGSGTPLTGETTSLTVTGTPGVAATCSVNLVIAAQPVAYTMTCGTIATTGNYAPGLAMDPATNTMTIPVTVTYAGSWTASTNTVNGVTFSGSGTFSTIGGGQSITLKASGMPVSGGPFTFTISTNSTIPGTCTKAITFIYRTMNVLALGYGIYAPYTASSSQATRAILQNTASFGPTGKVQMQGFNIIDGGDSNSNATLLKSNINSKKIDIIVMMYNVQPNAAVAAVLADFVKNKKGVLIHGQELGDSSNAAMIAAICGGSASIGGISHNNNVVTSSDPVIDGPFGNISGKRIGVDAGVTGVSASNLPAGVTVLSTRSSDAAAAYAFKHDTLGYLWIGDGGVFAGNSSNGSGDIYPAAISATGLPIDKSYTGGTVSNSTFYANAMAWAVKYAQQNVKVDYVIP